MYSKIALQGYGHRHKDASSHRYVTAVVVRCAQFLYTENRQHGSTTCLDKIGSFMVPYLKEKEEPK